MKQRTATAVAEPIRATAKYMATNKIPSPNASIAMDGPNKNS